VRASEMEDGNHINGLFRLSMLTCYISVRIKKIAFDSTARLLSELSLRQPIKR
jgi:hypothetical protein